MFQKLTDSVDDAAESVASAIHGGQISDSFLSHFVLQEESTISLIHTAVTYSYISNIIGKSILVWHIRINHEAVFIPAQPGLWQDLWCSHKGTGASESMHGWR